MKHKALHPIGMGVIVAMIIIIKQKITSVGENMEKLKPLHGLMPIIPTTWEAEIGGLWLEAG
jgi:hypothetical protein